MNRTTPSATYHVGFGEDGIWATTLAFGINAGREIIPGGAFDAVTRAVLLESSVTSHERHTWFGRAEVVEKPAHDLHAHEYATSIFPVGKLQAGFVRYFSARNGVVPGIGGTVSASLVPPELAPGYSGRLAPGFGMFITVRPSRHVM